MTEADYPYHAKRSHNTKCSEAATKGVVEAKSYKDVQPKSWTQFKAALNKGPVAIGIEADKSVFQLYSGGVMNSKKCGTRLDHGVLAVGYGTYEGTEYVLVKNSWGASWGKSGYIMLGAEENICGFMDSASI